MTDYLTYDEVIELHRVILNLTASETVGLRDSGLLESAIMRPQMSAYYEQADLIRQATLLAVGISQAHAFIDGNKRTAFIACDAFLRRNGLQFSGEALDLARQLEIVADRNVTIDDATNAFESWLRTHVASRE